MRLILWGICLCLSAASGSARAADPAAIIAQAKQAAGGDAWNAVRALHLQFHTLADGLSGTQEEWDDVQAGRYVVRSERPTGATASGFDGVSVWTQAHGGYSYVLGDEDARQGAVNEAYQTCRAYWFPDRASATLALEGVQQEAGHAYDVIGITPQAGRPFRVWIDRATHLIDRFVEQQGEDVQIIRLMDYRAVPDGIRLPFTIRIGDGDPQWDEVDTVKSAAVNVSLAPGQFALPPNPAPDFRFLSGKTSTTIPFRLEDNKILVSVRLNGHGPLEAELDSGGNYIIQPATAERLRLTGQGASQDGGGGEGFVAASRVTVGHVDIGDIRLTNQPYKILRFAKKAPERTIIGLQILQRLVVSIDFDKQTITLTQPDKFAYHGTGAVIPFHFQDNQPEVYGAVDGIAGVFTIDTGDDGSLLLIAPFVQRYGLVERYKATISYGGSAVGGATHGLRTTAGAVALFGPDGRPSAEAYNPATRLSQQKGGFDADRYVSGNIGLGILKQFNLIFDYSRQQIILEKNQNYVKKTTL
jgi:hypothetical protein